MPEVMTRGALLGLHAQTALHPGAGTALGAVDLPVQRERHTHWPNIAGSALKGILRDACRGKIAEAGDLDEEQLVNAERKMESKKQRADNTMKLAALFGPPTADSSDFAGAVSVTDARLLAFPVRSLRGVFAWATCPAALERLVRDAELAGSPEPFKIPPAFSNHAVVAPGCPCLIDGRLVLEEFEFKQSPGDVSPVALWVAANLLPNSNAYKATAERFKRHLVLLSDDDFTHFARHATEVCARVGLNYETKTVKDGALFYQEFLPAETLLYAVVLANPARARQITASGQELLGRLRGYLKQVPMLQIGGDETTGDRKSVV